MVSELTPLELGKGSYQTRALRVTGCSLHHRRRRIRRAGLRSRCGKICFNKRLPSLYTYCVYILLWLSIHGRSSSTTAGRCDAVSGMIESDTALTVPSRRREDERNVEYTTDAKLIARREAKQRARRGELEPPASD